MLRALFLASLVWSPFPVYGLGTEDVLFYAPFDGSCDAGLARGNGKASTGSALKFMKGVRGQAVIVGGTLETRKRAFPVSYATEGNILREQGSLAIWVQALDWKIPDGKNHRFVTLPGRGVTYYFYVFYPGNTWWLLLKKGGNRPVGGWNPKWNPGDWHHLVATWEEGEMAVFVDGKQTGRATENVPLPEALGKAFTLGRHDGLHTALDELTVFRRPLAKAEVKALYRKVTAPPQPATAIVSDDPGRALQLAGILDDITGQVVLDEDVTARLWTDDKLLHVAVNWVIPEYFRKNPTAYNGRALRRGSKNPLDDDSFEIRAGKYHIRVGPDGTKSVTSQIDMNHWSAEVSIPRSDLGGDTFGFEFQRHWRELRRLDASWRGKLTIRSNAKTATIRTATIRQLADSVPDDVPAECEVKVPGAYQASLPFVRAAPFRAVLHHFPSENRLLVEVTRPQATVTVGEVTKTGQKQLSFNVSKLGIGSHEVIVRLGKKEKRYTFKIKPRPEWLTAKAGISDEVPPP